MKVDFDACLGAVSRTVSALEREGKPAANVTLEKLYDTTPEDLWDAITNPERLPRWFLPVSGDLRLDGTYQLEGNAGGTIKDCRPPHFLSVTWEFGEGVSWLEVHIEEEGEAQSRLKLSHICPVDDHWQKFGPGAVGVGWDLGLLGLMLYVERDTERIDDAAFAASSDGKNYITAVSLAWQRAAVASGEDEAGAIVAAKRTTAFYTGVPYESEDQ